MNENFGQKIMDWLDINRGSVAVGIICGVIGVVYGVAKGTSITNKIWMRDSNRTH